jgi:hypothetical protein
MSAWEVMAIWFGVSMVGTPVIGYCLSVLAKSQTSRLESQVIQFRPQTAEKDTAPRWQPELGASVFRS